MQQYVDSRLRRNVTRNRKKFYTELPNQVSTTGFTKSKTNF